MGRLSGSGILPLGLRSGGFGVVRTGIGSTSQSSKFLLPWFSWLAAFAGVHARTFRRCAGSCSGLVFRRVATDIAAFGIYFGHWRCGLRFSANGPGLHRAYRTHCGMGLKVGSPWGSYPWRGIAIVAANGVGHGLSLSLPPIERNCGDHFSGQASVGAKTDTGYSFIAGA